MSLGLWRVGATATLANRMVAILVDVGDLPEGIAIPVAVAVAAAAAVVVALLLGPPVCCCCCRFCT